MRQAFHLDVVYIVHDMCKLEVLFQEVNGLNIPLVVCCIQYFTNPAMLCRYLDTAKILQYTTSCLKNISTFYQL